MKTYTKPELSKVGDFAAVTLKTSSTNANWVKGGSDVDPGTLAPATKIVKP